MENVDVIMLSHTKDLTYYGMTQRALNSLRLSEKDYNFDIKLLESNKDAASQKLEYSCCTTIVPSEKFNYNLYLNYGLEKCSTDWLVVANNDLVFMSGWFSEIMRLHRENPYVKSFSPFEPNWHRLQGFDPESRDMFFGYRTSKELAGWCIVIHRDVILDCNLFDPRFAFIYQDNDYAETIKSRGYTHALASRSSVYHVTAQSDGLIASEDRYSMFDAQESLFYSKWPEASRH